jgi:hypothetical protein
LWLGSDPKNALCRQLQSITNPRNIARGIWLLANLDGDVRIGRRYGSGGHDEVFRVMDAAPLPPSEPLHIAPGLPFGVASSHDPQPAPRRLIFIQRPQA